MPHWLKLLDAALPELLLPLTRVCSDKDRESTIRLTAAEVLAGVLSGRKDAEGLARAMIAAQPEASLVLLHELEMLDHRDSAKAFLHGVLAESPDLPADDRLVEHQASAAIALAVLGDSSALGPAFRHRPDP